jgi:hypothetical protein
LDPTSSRCAFSGRECEHRVSNDGAVRQARSKEMEANGGWSPIPRVALAAVTFCPASSPLRIAESGAWVLLEWDLSLHEVAAPTGKGKSLETVGRGS